MRRAKCNNIPTAIQTAMLYKLLFLFSRKKNEGSSKRKFQMSSSSCINRYCLFAMCQYFYIFQKKIKSLQLCVTVRVHGIG